MMMMTMTHTARRQFLRTGRQQSSSWQRRSKSTANGGQEAAYFATVPLLCVAATNLLVDDRCMAISQTEPTMAATMSAYAPSILEEPTTTTTTSHHHLHTAATTVDATSTVTVASPHHHQQQQQQEQDPYHISVRAVRGYRVTMEDEYCVAEGGRFTAIFDGHGGGKVSKLLKHSLYPTVQHYMKHNNIDDNDNDSVFSHVSALKQAFADLERRVLADTDVAYQGSTAVAVWIHEGHDKFRTLLSANIGDSRAVLSRQGQAVALTRDHKPNDEMEKARIHAMGETIEWDRYSKVHRVRNLSLSRAIGDKYAKPYVSDQVEIKHFPVQEEQDEFVILASDGLWDTMSSQDAVSFVHHKMKQELGRMDNANDLKNYKTVLRRHMSKFLTKEAIARGSGDNVCVILVWLKDE